MLFEFGLCSIIELFVSGNICNFWNIVYLFGGLFGGVGVLVVFGVVFIVYGNDGGGLFRIFVFCCGLIGLKLLCGRIVGIEGIFFFDIIC